MSKGRVGIPLGKLGRIAEETQRFLSLVDEDIGIGSGPNNWIARNFDNKSVDFDCYRVGDVTPNVIDRGNRLIRSIMSNDLSDAEINLSIRSATRLQYAKIADPIDSEEKVSFGLYTNGSAKPSEWFELTKESAFRVTKETPQTVSYYGEIQGIVHAFYKESNRPKLVVRELSTGALVNCFFKLDIYQKAVEMLLEPNAVIFVEGEIIEDQMKGQVESIQVAEFRLAPDFDESLFERFIGSQPNYTGELTTEEFIEKMREDS